MNKPRFFELKSANYHYESKDYKSFDILDVETGEQLEMVCVKYEYENKPTMYDPVGGAVGLLHSDKYEGYCQLYYTYRKKDDDGIVNIEFTPAYTKTGEEIFIKTNEECPFCSVDSKREYNHETHKIIERSYLTYFLKWIVA